MYVCMYVYIYVYYIYMYIYIYIVCVCVCVCVCGGGSVCGDVTAYNHISTYTCVVKPRDSGHYTHTCTHMHTHTLTQTQTLPLDDHDDQGIRDGREDREVSGVGA